MPYMFIIIVFWLGIERPSGVGISFFRTRFTSFQDHCSLLNVFFCFFALFRSCCSMHECLGKHSCMRSSFPVAILNGTCLFSDSATTSAECVFGAKKYKYWTTKRNRGATFWREFHIFKSAGTLVENVQMKCGTRARVSHFHHDGTTLVHEFYIFDSHKWTNHEVVLVGSRPFLGLHNLCGPVGIVDVSHAEGYWVASRQTLHLFVQWTRHSWAYTAHEGGGSTSQLDLPSLTPLSIAGCGRLQLGVPHWATSVDYHNLH